MTCFPPPTSQSGIPVVDSNQLKELRAVASVIECFLDLGREICSRQGRQVSQFMSKKPRTYTQRFLLENPRCCFCGGDRPATTRDHVPAKIFFDGKLRPKGIEVPACNPCQEYTKKHELVCATFARMFPDTQSKQQRIEIRKLLRRAGKAVPGLLDELRPSPEQAAQIHRIQQKVPKAAGILNADGPLVTQSLDINAVKLTCALHYEHTRNIVRIGSPVSTRVYSNVDALEGNLPHEFINLMSQRMTLRQGKWSVPDQFEYAYIIDKDTERAAYFSTFRHSFAVIGLVWKGIEELPAGQGMRTFTPQRNSQFLQIR